MTKTPFYQDPHARAVRRDHGGRTSRGLSVELARFCYENPIFRDDPDELLLDLKQCSADCIGPGCEPCVRPSPGQNDQSASLAAPAEADQVEGTPVNPFSSFLSSEIKRVRIHLDAFGVDYFDRPALENYLDDLCRASAVYSRFLRSKSRLDGTHQKASA